MIIITKIKLNNYLKINLLKQNLSKLYISNVNPFYKFKYLSNNSLIYLIDYLNKFKNPAIRMLINKK